ncbi:MAG: hypothetical protein IKX60_04220 [Bacteroidales bacterium]|nr:hypothetical protein [Bacteroidales bacterium]
MEFNFVSDSRMNSWSFHICSTCSRKSNSRRKSIRKSTRKSIRRGHG